MGDIQLRYLSGPGQEKCGAHNTDTEDESADHRLELRFAREGYEPAEHESRKAYGKRPGQE